MTSFLPWSRIRRAMKSLCTSGSLEPLVKARGNGKADRSAKPGPISATVEGISARVLWRLALVVGIGWLPALLGQGVIARVSALYGLGVGPHPYFQPSQAGLLYVIIPLVVLSSFLLYLSPGGILVLALGQARSLAEWVILAFGTSLVLSIILGTGAKLVSGLPLTWSILLPLWLISTVAAWMLLVFRRRRGSVMPWPIAQRPDIRRLLGMGGASWVGVAVLLPKLFWENFNLDGIEAFEFGRSLADHVLPYWELQDSVFGFYHNFVLFAYPNHWFIALLGPFEAAVRVPFILYLVVLSSALVMLIEHRQQRSLSGTEEAVLWLGLATFTVVQVYNTNYEPFFADIAEMAATDTLWMTCFLLACYALWTDRVAWFWVYALMAHTASPGGLLLLGCLAVATFLTRSPGWRKRLWILGGVFAVGVWAGVAHEYFYNRLLLGGVNDQFSATNMLRRLYPPTFTEFVRWNALLFPSGLLPAISLTMVRRKEPISWQIAFVTAAYFAIVYVQAWTSLHQFTPVMLLPLIVFWRLYLRLSRRLARWLLPMVTATTVLSLVLSLPRHFRIDIATREFGRVTSYRVGDYERDYEAAVGAGWSLYTLLPEDYRLEYPEQPWGTDPFSWIYYASRQKPPGTTVNYVVQSSRDPPPQDTARIADREGVSVYVRDLEAWQRDRDREWPGVVQSPLYEPILRRTYQFFQAYVEQLQQQTQEGTGAEGE